MQPHSFDISQSDNHRPLLLSSIMAKKCSFNRVQVQAKETMLGSAFNTTVASNRGLNRDNPCPYSEIYRSTSHRILMNVKKRIQTYLLAMDRVKS